MKFIIYKVTFPNKKIYIGITSKDLKVRKRNHYASVNSGSKFKFHNALRKYKGKEKWNIISTKIKSWQELCALEIFYIKKYDSVNKGYNSTSGGEGILNPSKITRYRMSVWQKGKKLSKEHRRKLSEAKMGKKYGKRQNVYKTSKPFKLILKDTNEVLKVFSNVSECARYLNIPGSYINRNVKKQIKYKQYRFEYVGE